MQNGKLVLIRHAEFVKPVPGAYYGQSDLPLTEQGEAQARSLSRRLKAIAPDISRIECSDLKRAVRTAELALPACQPELNHSLRENLVRQMGRQDIRADKRRAGVQPSTPAAAPRRAARERSRFCRARNQSRRRFPSANARALCAIVWRTPGRFAT